MLTRRKVFLSKVEGTYRVDSSPGATDAVLAENLAWSSENLSMVERPAIKATLGPLQQIYAGRLLGIAVTAEMKGSGSAGTAPEIGSILRASGFGETIVGGASVTYAPVSESFESTTSYLYEDGTRINVLGCRGSSLSFSLEARNKAMLNATLLGHEVARTDVAVITPTYDSTVPAPIIDASFSIGGFAAVTNSLSIDMNITASAPSSMSDDDGFGEVQITDFDISGTFDPEDELVATNDFIGDFKAGATGEMSVVIGATAGNIITFTLSDVYYRDVAPGDRDGVATLEIPFGASDLSIAFT